MNNELSLGIRLTYDSQPVTGGISVTREHFRQFTAEGRKATDALGSGSTAAARGVRSISDHLANAKAAAIRLFGATSASSPRVRGTPVSA